MSIGRQVSLRPPPQPNPGDEREDGEGEQPAEPDPARPALVIQARRHCDQGRAAAGDDTQHEPDDRGYRADEARDGRKYRDSRRADLDGRPWRLEPARVQLHVHHTHQGERCERRPATEPEPCRTRLQCAREAPVDDARRTHCVRGYVTGERRRLVVAWVPVAGHPQRIAASPD